MFKRPMRIATPSGEVLNGFNSVVTLNVAGLHGDVYPLIFTKPNYTFRQWNREFDTYGRAFRHDPGGNLYVNHN